MEIRLNKFISDSGFCSRREADRFIERGKVTINKKIAQMGAKVVKGDIVKVNGTPIENDRERVYIALNKPVGIVCTTDMNERNNITDFVHFPHRIFNIGRLDKMSEGLILLTNDGDIVNKILRSSNNHEKEYEVVVDKPINEQFLDKMRNGVPILGTTTRKCKVEMQTPTLFKITLTQGLNRQIRRMCEALGYEVLQLKRTRVMNITLAGLDEGQWRLLEEDELSELNESLEGSDSAPAVRSGSARANRSFSKNRTFRSSTSSNSRPGNRNGFKPWDNSSAKGENEGEKPLRGGNSKSFGSKSAPRTNRSSSQGAKGGSSKGFGGSKPKFGASPAKKSSTFAQNRAKKSSR